MSADIVINQIPDNRIGDSTRKGVATVSAAMIAYLQLIGYLLGYSECAKGKPPGDSLCHRQKICLEIGFIYSEHWPGAAETCLDLIHDKERAVCFAKPGDILQISFRRDTNAPFALNRFQNDSSNVTVEGVPNSIQIVV
ncbi:hypothetical protein DSCOOX_48670 [Desulfosarcina ovata subsp. ovata]|uniref:Uncharacterized protein n=1 Tax=Desulfosarcina ovata subsp. ovata TaxID=2752305 RepID=A0A5K8AGC1_9BACT|nr:hypothetical protein DSCOOX_48670 [Desulfosarcina ovata subsp. ovata]